MDRYMEIPKLQEYGVVLTKENLEYIGKLKERYELFKPFGELIPLADVIYTGGKYTWQGCIIALRVDGTLICPRKLPSEDKYRFHLPNPYRHRHLEYYESRLRQPGRVGVLSEKKLKAWITYLLAEEQEKKEAAARIIRREEDYRDELKKLGPMVRWENMNKAIIERNNLRFAVYFNPGRISTELTLVKDYGITLPVFLDMIGYQAEALKTNKTNETERI
jgi:hypothetical protein